MRSYEFVNSASCFCLWYPRVLFCWYESCPHHVIGTIKTRIPVFQPQFLQGFPFMLMNSSHSPRKGVGAVVCSHTMQVWLKMVCTLIFGRIHISYVHFGYHRSLSRLGNLIQSSVPEQKVAPLHFEGRHER